MKRKTLYLILVIVVIIGSYFVYQYLYKDHRDIASEVSVMEISASDILTLFNDGDGEALLNKTLTVTGTVTQLESQSLTMNESVHCVFSEAIEMASTGQMIKVKGRCIGYDDLLEIIKLDQCSLIK
tara:strand:+ start:12427 stop:12804 length:378 start_codon:yes stop_codon:yes gene_type:complete